jgi:hypothetical protein
MLHDFMYYHTNPYKHDSIRLTKNLGNTTCLWKRFTTLDQKYLGCWAQPIMHPIQHLFIISTFHLNTTRILHALLNTQQITSPLHKPIYILSPSIPYVLPLHLESYLSLKNYFISYNNLVFSYLSFTIHLCQIFPLSILNHKYIFCCFCLLLILFLSCMILSS